MCIAAILTQNDLLLCNTGLNQLVLSVQEPIRVRAYNSAFARNGTIPRQYYYVNVNINQWAWPRKDALRSLIIH